jgi:hypothetical protein
MKEMMKKGEEVKEMKQESRGRMKERKNIRK